MDIFPLLYQTSGEDSVLFVLGRTIRINGLLGLEEVLELIASGQLFTVYSSAAAIPS